MSRPEKYVDDKKYKRLLYLTTEEWKDMSIETKHKMWLRGLSYGSDNPLLKLVQDVHELEDRYKAHLRELNQRTEFKNQIEKLEEDKDELQDTVEVLIEENLDLLLNNQKKSKVIEQLKEQLARSETEGSEKLREQINSLEAELSDQKRISSRIISTLETEITQLTYDNRKFKEFITQQVTELRDAFAAKLRQEINITIETSTFNRKLNQLMNQFAV